MDPRGAGGVMAAGIQIGIQLVLPVAAAAAGFEERRHTWVRGEVVRGPQRVIFYWAIFAVELGIVLVHDGRDWRGDMIPAEIPPLRGC